MRAFLDTNLLISNEVDFPDLEVVVSSISWAELRYGISKSSDPLNRARRAAQLARLRSLLGPGIPFDDTAAEAYEAICQLVLANGRQVRGRSIDLMIAATAASNGSALITRNLVDFVGLEGMVRVLSPEATQ